MMRVFVLAILFVSCVRCYSQQTGEVDYPYLGIKFTIPNGWKGAESGGGFIMASDTKPGIIFMVPHDVKDLSTLKMEAEAGMQDENLTLRKSSSFEQLGPSGVAAEFEGTIQGQPAKAYVVGLINPFGMGVTIIATTTLSQYSEEYRKLARDVAMSLKFSHPVEPPVTKEWRDALKGARLTYLKSNYSSGGSVNGYSTYSGYSTHNEIHLCPDGNFSYASNSSMSIDTGGAFAGGGGDKGGMGKWSVESNSAGEPVLKLNFSNGEVYSYKLGYENSKTYLNGERYFRTYDAKCN